MLVTVQPTCGLSLSYRSGPHLPLCLHLPQLLTTSQIRGKVACPHSDSNRLGGCHMCGVSVELRLSVEGLRRSRRFLIRATYRHTVSARNIIVGSGCWMRGSWSERQRNTFPSLECHSTWAVLGSIVSSVLCQVKGSSSEVKPTRQMHHRFSTLVLHHSVLLFFLCFRGSSTVAQKRKASQLFEW